MPPRTIDDEERLEIRLALVMTGGVSLAVWMGGVAAELHRAIRADGVFGDILDLTRSSVAVDVIGGTSAGGVNGGFLAAALANGTDMDRFRSVWLELGSLLALFRPDTETHPPSLLKGDEYFLSNLRTVFAAMTGTPTDPSAYPMHLVMTTTLMKGQRRAYQDRYGGQINDLSHRGTFTFVRNDERDDFAEGGIGDRLALAARSTASFPGAFEPSFIPLGAADVDPTHPDMSAHADFAAGGFVIDGGVLSNKPIGPVLRVLFNRQTEGQGRRVLAYVIPDPSLPKKDAPEAPGIPWMTKVVTKGMNIPRVESVVEDLEAIRSHNQRVNAQRRLREALLRGGDGTAAQPDVRVDPVVLAAQLYPAYVGARREYAARSILDTLDRAVRTSGGGAWDRTELRRHLAAALDAALPDRFPADEAVATWGWDIAGVKSGLSIVFQLLSIGLEVASSGDEAGTVREALRSHIRDLRAVRRSLQRIQRAEDAHWRSLDVQPLRDAASLDPAARDERLRTWTATALAGSLAATPSAELLELVRRTGEIGTAALAPLHEAAGPIGGPPSPKLSAMVGGLSSATSAIGPNLRRLLAVIVVQAAFAGSEPVVEQIVELMQISADMPNGFDDRDTGAEKLAGLQLGHFGAFYKRSWRANDWMWGRLDAIPSMLRVLLDPARLRRLADNEPAFAADLVRRVREIALGDEHDGTRAVLEPLWDADAVGRELDAVRDPAAPLPDALPACGLALMRRMQLGILQEELPHVAAAVRHDLSDGALARPEAVVFLERTHQAQVEQGDAKPDATASAPPARRGAASPRPEVAEDQPLRPQDAVPLFGLCRVGEERIDEESDSPLYHRTAGAATAVGLRAARRHVTTTNDTLGHKPSIRATLPVVMPLVRGVATSSKSVFVAVILLLAGGAALFGFAFGAETTRWVPAVFGTILVVLGLGLALLRIRSFVVAGSVVVGAIALLVVSFAAPNGSAIATGWFRAAVVLVLLAGLLVLAWRERPRVRATKDERARVIDPWAPLAPSEVAGTFADVPFPWWVAGGHAIDLFVGRVTRPHEDLDVQVLRRDQEAIRARLHGWDLQTAFDGRLEPWEPRAPLPSHVNGVWCRRETGSWRFELLFNDAEAGRWVFRRDARIWLPLADVGLRTPDGIPFVAPEVQLLYKAKGARPRDDADLAVALPLMEAPRRAWLARSIELVHPGHPWLEEGRGLERAGLATDG